ncbi:hypothetical protein FRB95_005912 [Tulasnella sp. JGI-2019a]|nr:hypothetical protein FRB95_005912 [Tulasnella sp. JGI-2019a]
MDSQTFSAFEEVTFGSSFSRCLEKYQALLLERRNDEHSILDSATTMPSQSFNPFPVPPHSTPDECASVVQRDTQMHLKVWIQAAEACGCIADAFMSLRRPKPASEYASTSLGCMFEVEAEHDEQAQHEQEAQPGGINDAYGDHMAVIMEEPEQEAAAELDMEEEERARKLGWMGYAESDDEDSELDEEAQEELLARCRSRRTSFSYTHSGTPTGTSPTPELNTVTPTTPVLSSPMEQAAPPPTDPEGLWSIRAPEWSWTPGSPSVPSMTLIPPPEDAFYPAPLHNTYAWTPLQSALCPRTGREQLPVRQSYVFNNDGGRHPGCVTCTPDYAAWVKESLKESWGIIESEDMCSGVLDMTADEQSGWGLHARVWQHTVGSCVCKELEGWYAPEHTPGQDVHEEDHEDEQYEEVADAMTEHGYDTASGISDDCYSVSDHDELRTPAGGATYMELPAEKDTLQSVMALTMEMNAFVDSEEAVTLQSSPVISKSALPCGTPSSPLSSPKTPRWMDLDEDDLEELPDLSDW